VFEDHKTGMLQVEFYETLPGGSKRTRLTLGHRNRERAKRQADRIATDLVDRSHNLSTDPSLEELFDIYLREVTPTKSAAKQKHDRGCAQMFKRLFGRQRKVRTLSHREWDHFIRERRSGRLAPAGKEKPAPVGARQVAYDLAWLRAVLNWATVAGDGEGGVLLDRNPLSGLKLPREPSPRRPIMTEERFRAMLAVAPAVDWRLEAALILAYETGHRINSIRQLRFSDIDLDTLTIRWRAAHDKLGHEHVTPITTQAADALRQARRRQPRLGEGWILPSPRDQAKPCCRHLVRRWWLRAEERAKLEHVRGMGWHSLRRMFATELKDEPLKDLCALGGWKSHQTVLACYRDPEEARMRQALENRRRLRAV
jgi:integrase